MKSKNIYFRMAIAALLGVSAASCTDGNDWDVDGSHSRLFGLNASKLSIEAEDVQVTLTFTGVPDAEYYIVEVSTDSLYDEVPMGGEHAIVYGEDKSMTNSPVVLTNLAGDTRYYLRVKAMASGWNDSKWSYFRSGGTFKTLAEQIFNEVSGSDRFEDRIRLSWLPGAEVTNIVVSIGDEEVDNIALDDAAKVAGEYEMTGLRPSTSYTFVIYNDDVKRGTLTASTTAAMPDGDHKVELPAGTTLIDQDMINQIAAEAQEKVGSDQVSVTIGIPADSQIDVHGVSEEGNEKTSIKLPEGVSVTFFGMAGGDKPVLNFPKSLNIGGGRSYIRFENVAITDGGCQYLVNQSADATLSELSFKQCTVSNFERSFIRTQGGVVNIDNIIVDDCVLTNMASGNGYSVFYFGTETTNVGKLELLNSTFDTSQRSFIEASKAPITDGVFITNCTFYNNVQDGRYLMDANGQATNLTAKNTIFGKTYNPEKAKGVRTNGTMTFDGCLRTSDCLFGGGNDIKNLDVSDMSSDDVFKDPENHDFTLKIYDQIGDPRWWFVEE